MKYCFAPVPTWSLIDIHMICMGQEYGLGAPDPFPSFGEWGLGTKLILCGHHIHVPCGMKGVHISLIEHTANF